MVPAISTEGLAKSFGSTLALRPLDLEVAEGEVLGYLGPNGAGKTTTIRCLLGLIRASAGRAEIFGVDAQANPAEAHRRLAYVPGEANLWPGLTSHLGPVPAAALNWTAIAWLIGLGLVAALAGLATFNRRDLIAA